MAERAAVDGSARGVEVSVVIPCRDPDPSELGAQLDALAAQRTERAFEVVVVDNGSRQPLVDRLPDRIGPAPVRVVEMGAMSGVNLGRAAGVRAARADRILLCDADDIVDATWLDAAARHLDDDVVVAGPRKMFFEEPGDAPGMEQTRLRTSHGRPWSSGSSLGFTRQVMDLVGGFDESWPADMAADDVDFALRCADAGIEYRFEPAMSNNYRLRAGLRPLLRQRRRYGRGSVRLDDRHDPGTDRSAQRRAMVRPLVNLAKSTPRGLRDPLGRWHLVRRFGFLLGRAEGLLRPVHRAPARGMGADVDDPTVAIVFDVDVAPSRRAAALEVLRPCSAGEVEVVALESDGGHVSDQVTVIPVSTTSVPAARDVALERLDTDLALFVDAHRRLDPGWVTRHVDLLRVFDLSVEADDLGWSSTWRGGLVPHVRLGSLGVRREAVVALGGFAPLATLGERAVRAGARVAEVSRRSSDSELRSLVDR